MSPEDEGSSNGPRTARRQILQLAVRLFGAEIDAPLFSRLLQVEQGQVGALHAPRIVLLDAALASLSPRAALEELSVEFCRLFVGPNPCCPPYASVQRNGLLLGGRTARDLESFMTRAGIELSTSNAFASTDHLAVQLSTLALLDEQEALGERHDQACSELLLGHLLPWAPAYLRAVAVAASWAPYRTLSAVTAGILETWETVGSEEAGSSRLAHPEPEATGLARGA
jgi:TorA maturation chaperone TorD